MASGGLALVALLLLAPVCLAGPPFLTDDPIPVEPGHWEINNYSAATFGRGAVAGVLPGVDANYGAVENLQLHVLVPIAFSQWGGTSMQYGAGDIEIGAKYRFLPAAETDWWPQIAFYPFLDFPTGNTDRNLGTGATHAFFPIWLQKDFGKWTVYGGGGYWINPGSDNQNFWFAGGVLQYQLTDHLALAGEIFYQTASMTGAPDSAGYPLGSKNTTGFNIGGTYDINATYHVLFSVGRGLDNAVTNDFSYYLALQLKY